ncbi:HAMP domain-containing histidine kinase [Bacillus sp. BHET2]|uniref:HAMP domain-containing sensor histidine kinase n=1 Tax=Bacillus sp. BHET2 TaxID=2583818 RepID=UPI00110EE320|nr:HAMP domain-containing sensor histidine kinase [Bacillus sp. BHET2]TMU84109.1 HAMP domain-containing histidine kinase [Bacillus sp. BHET2]
MFTKNKPSLLRYWTTRYLITLIVGLLVIAIISALWIRKTTIDNRLNLTHVVAQEVADRIVTSDGQIMIPPILKDVVKERSKFLQLDEPPLTYVINPEGHVLSDKDHFRGPRDRQPPFQQIPSSFYEKREVEIELDGDQHEKAYAISEPIESEDEVLGYVVMITLEKNLAKVNQEYRLLAIMLVSLALLGWLVIYYLSRKLSAPIAEVAQAAMLVSEGNYEISLEQKAKEKEVYELVDSFQQMATKLQNLEQLRSELLAGVTHDLKTPVTSISGLIQAVKDEVVTEGEAKEFLDISLKEVDRLQRMIGDLLDFNSFSAGAIPIRTEWVNMNELVEDITKHWEQTQVEKSFDLSLSLEEVEAQVDPLRIEQILINLLNNGRQSLSEDQGELIVRLLKKENRIAIEVQDTGSGIPENEQKLIFERFYRGEHKKLKVRGLGLGLPFSKMLAKAQGGNLYLKDSSPSGTTFVLELPHYK